MAVRVAVHIRPLIEAELAKGCQEILEVAPDQAQVLQLKPLQCRLSIQQCVLSSS